MISCKNDPQLVNLKNQLTLVKKGLIWDNTQIELDFERMAVLSRSLKIYHERAKKINALGFAFADPQDSSFYFNTTEKELEAKYDSSINMLYACLPESFCNKYSIETVVGDSTLLGFVPLSTDMDYRMVNILTNQINILTIQKRIMQISKSEIGCVQDYQNPELMIIADSISKVNEPHIAQLVFGYRDFNKPAITLINMKLNGQAVNPPFKTGIRNGISEFQFTPTIEGLYEYELEFRYTTPAGGYKYYTFKGQFVAEI